MQYLYVKLVLFRKIREMKYFFSLFQYCQYNYDQDWISQLNPLESNSELNVLVVF